MSETESDGRDPLEVLAEEFLERVRAGESPSIEEFASRCPDLAEEVRGLFPTLLLMEDPASAGGESKNSKQAETLAFDRLGEYRVLRQIGRGGMGVVFEAEQETLGRHVALKVLGSHLVANDIQIARFRREARAAARLHHTNIVPVFGFGEDSGVHYYAMQFIRGQSLDAVLAAVARMRSSVDLPVASPNDTTARELATGMISRHGVSSASTNAVADPGSSTLDVEVRDVKGEPARTGERPEAANPQDSSTLDATRSVYHASVARIGHQIASALAYAHGEGVLHRDIKPANLLLDDKSTAWVTDFGLAKAIDSEGLTASGSVVGTLAYIAPERFQGREDARSDVYSLGITLYELLALRPAFQASDRAQLMQEVMAKEPTALRAIDLSIPRDLQTIVDKAIAKSPGDRYDSAQDLADDLERFRNFEPILARRVGSFERVKRWCQRNPASAAMSGVIAALLVSIAIASVVVSYQLRDERDIATGRLYKAKLEEARARRLGGVSGQRKLALEALRAAAEGADLVEVRSEIMSALALTDVATESGSIDLFGTTHAASADGRRLAVVSRDWKQIEIWDSNPSGGKLRKIVPRQRVYSVEMSTTGSVLAVGNSRSKTTELWNTNSGKFLGQWPNGSSGLPIAFDASDSKFVMIDLDKSIVVRALPGGEELSRSPPQAGIRVVQIHPDGDRLAAVGDGASRFSVRIIRMSDWSELARLRHDKIVFKIAWHPAGRLLATVSRDFNAHVWDAETFERVHRLEAHTSEVVALAFSPDGRFLVTSGWDKTSFVWDPYSGRQMAHTPGRVTKFLPDSLRFGSATEGERYELRHIVGGGEYSLLHVPTAARQQKHPQSVSVSPDSKWLATSTSFGCRVWSAIDTTLSVDLFVGRVAGLCFDPGGEFLYLGAQKGLLRVPIRDSEGNVSLGPAERLTDDEGRMSTDAAGRVLAIQRSHRVEVLSMQPDLTRYGSYRHGGVSRVEVSSSGRWVGSGNWQGGNVVIWNVAERKEQHRVKGFSARIRFSPDERWAIVGDALEYRLFETETWTVVRKWANLSQGKACAAFSPDSQALALSLRNRGVDLVNLSNRELIAKFDAPDRGVNSWLEFSPDGEVLYGANPSGRSIRVWRLSAMRRRLGALDLDWDPPAETSSGSKRAPKSLRFLESEADRAAALANREMSRARRLAARRHWNGLVQAKAGPKANAGRARLDAILGAHDEAVADLDTALEIKPDNFEWRWDRAVLLIRLGRDEEAREDLDRLVETARTQLAEEHPKLWRERLIDALRRRADLGVHEQAEFDRREIRELETEPSRE